LEQVIMTNPSHPNQNPGQQGTSRPGQQQQGGGQKPGQQQQGGGKEMPGQEHQGGQDMPKHREDDR
jgi:type VI secretion system secreted protein VgrG